MRIRNKTLHEKIKKFIVSSISQLDNFSFKNPIPTKFEFFPATKEKNDYFLFIFNHFNQLEKLPEFLDCAKYLLKNPITRKALGWKDKEGNFLKDLPLELKYFRILHILLGTCVKLTDGFSFDNDIYEKVYQDFEKGIYSSFLVHKLTAPMEGIFGDFEEINFGNRIKIRRITNEEKESITQQALFPSLVTVPKTGIWHLEFLLEGFYTHAKGTSIKTSTVTNEFKEIVTALRLFKSGSVGYSYVKTKTLTWTTNQMGTSYGWGYSRQGIIDIKSYELKKSEKPELLSLWRKYSKFRKSLGSLDTGRFFNLAIKWFNMGVEENDYENKIIDFFVSFEALCLPERSELSYRLSNRVALLLGRDCEESEKIRKFMIKAYKIRSDIVHGAKVSPIFIDGEKIHLRDFSKKVEQYLRDVLKTFLVLSGSHKKQAEIIELIDKALLDVKIRKKIHRLR